MNQILYIDNSKKSGTTDIMKIAKISSIIIIVIAVLMMAKGIFSMVKNADTSNNPVVTMQEIDGRLEIKINHTKSIDKIIYSWNNDKENTLQGRGRTELNETIEIPTGNNILHLKIVDTDKQTSEYTKEYYKSEDTDYTKPEIELIVEGSKLKISVKDDKELDNVVYYWNDEDQTEIQITDENKKQAEERIAILKGENTLTVIATDTAGNEQIKEQVYKGAHKPTISITQENDEVIITAYDEENIKKIELTLNGEFFSTDSNNTGESLDMQEAVVRQKLKSGVNTITITVYNVSGLSEQKNETITI